MTVLDWQVLLVAVAATFSALFVLGYGLFAPWYRSSFGRSRIMSELSLSVLLWLSLLAYWLHFLVPDWASVLIFAGIAAASVLQFAAFIDEQWRKRR